MSAEHWRTPADGGESGLLWHKIASVVSVAKNLVVGSIEILKPEKEPDFNPRVLNVGRAATFSEVGLE